MRWLALLRARPDARYAQRGIFAGRTASNALHHLKYAQRRLILQLASAAIVREHEAYYELVRSLRVGRWTAALSLEPHKSVPRIASRDGRVLDW